MMQAIKCIFGVLTWIEKKNVTDALSTYSISLLQIDTVNQGNCQLVSVNQVKIRVFCYCCIK